MFMLVICYFQGFTRHLGCLLRNGAHLLHTACLPYITHLPPDETALIWKQDTNQTQTSKSHKIADYRFFLFFFSVARNMLGYSK